MRQIRLISFLTALFLIFSTTHLSAYAAEDFRIQTQDNGEYELYNDIVIDGINFLNDKQLDSGTWIVTRENCTAAINNIFEYLYSKENDCNQTILSMLYKISDYYYDKLILNNEDLFQYAMIDDICDDFQIGLLIHAQNLDGGFGVSDGYASDIIDTKLAMKALADVGETEAMNKAAKYIASLQNDDGGFSYQRGLESDPGLSAEIADVYGDCIIADHSIASDFSDTLNALETYLDENLPSLDILSADSMAEVYQHFYTVLFKLKKGEKVDVSSYYTLQAEDGGVFDDPLATALFLEMIVREQNSLTAGIDHISITNDKGYSVSSFNADENVHIDVASDYETEKAYQKITVETPSGETIDIDADNPVWNTADSEEGIYTVKAEIIRSSNQETVTSLTQEFRILHQLSVDRLSLVLSQGYSRVGDKDIAVSVSADIGIQNYSEDSDSVTVRWHIDTDEKTVSSGSREITGADLAAESVNLLDFAPDTSSKRTYTITAELVKNDLTVMQASTNYFVSDKGVAIVTDTDKDCLYETSDNAEISVKLRDERVVDLIFTTASDDTELISKYAGEIDNIRRQLEHLGYIVNLSNVDTSYLTAKDTFAWTEYDHPNYDTQSPYTKHIIYEDDDIKMAGYYSVPFKDFLLVPDENDSEKTFTFDIRRDKTDWHSMNGGGFLFNTEVSEDKISGYYVLITEYGLRLFSIDGMNLDSFRNSGDQGSLLATFPFQNVYDEHHIVIKANKDKISLWDGDNKIIDGYSLPRQYGNGYGPITSHASHCCSQRSYFTFANITMQTITGEKLADVLDGYGFQSPDSRYVINLSDSALDDLTADSDYKNTADKIMDNGITFIGLGNDSNREQYQTLVSETNGQGMYYDYGDDATAESLGSYIISQEEGKRQKQDDSVVATDLVFKGTLPDGRAYSKTFESLCSGETIDFTIPVSPDGLVAGDDAVLLDGISLSYKDENGISRKKDHESVTLPVLMPEDKITNQVTTDRPEYYENEDVVISDRIHNVFSNRSAKGLTNVIDILNDSGDVIKEYTKDLAEIMPDSYAERKETWNTGTIPAGTYMIRSDVCDGERLLSRSTAEIEIKASGLSAISLTGQLDIADKAYDISDTITVDSLVTNVGGDAVTDGKTVIRVIDIKNGDTVYQSETALNLEASASDTGSISFVPKSDFSELKGSLYLVTFEAQTPDGRIIPLSGNGFRLNTVRLYFVDSTEQHWVHNDGAVMELVDNTKGHDHYDMTQLDEVTWYADVPASAYNITFNRFDAGKTTQWNSWSAGGRDGNNTYFATVPEHGHWGYVEYANDENYFHAGDVVYLDLSQFDSWKNDNALMYVNFSDATKAENGEADIEIAAMSGSDRYQPRQITTEPDGNIYSYTVTSKDEGKTMLRFWRGNESTLWNCSTALDYDSYKAGNNCVRVTGWNEHGDVYAK